MANPSDSDSSSSSSTPSSMSSSSFSLTSASTSASAATSAAPSPSSATDTMISESVLTDQHTPSLAPSASYVSGGSLEENSPTSVAFTVTSESFPSSSLSASSSVTSTASVSSEQTNSSLPIAISMPAPLPVHSSSTPSASPSPSPSASPAPVPASSTAGGMNANSLAPNGGFGASNWLNTMNLLLLNSIQSRLPIPPVNMNLAAAAAAMNLPLMNLPMNLNMNMGMPQSLPVQMPVGMNVSHLMNANTSANGDTQNQTATNLTVPQQQTAAGNAAAMNLQLFDAFMKMTLNPAAVNGNNASGNSGPANGDSAAANASAAYQQAQLLANLAALNLNQLQASQQQQQHTQQPVSIAPNTSAQMAGNATTAANSATATGLEAGTNSANTNATSRQLAASPATSDDGVNANTSNANSPVSNAAGVTVGSGGAVGTAVSGGASVPPRVDKLAALSGTSSEIAASIAAGTMHPAGGYPSVHLPSNLSSISVAANGLPTGANGFPQILPLSNSADLNAAAAAAAAAAASGAAFGLHSLSNGGAGGPAGVLPLQGLPVGVGLNMNVGSLNALGVMPVGAVPVPLPVGMGGVGVGLPGDLSASFGNENFLVLAKSQAGSRLLQSRLTSGDVPFFHQLFDEIFEHFPELMVDLFGNYLCQRIIALANEAQRILILRKVLPALISISCDRQGTRAMQKLIECATTHRERSMIIDAISGFTTNQPSHFGAPPQHGNSPAKHPHQQQGHRHGHPNMPMVAGMGMGVGVGMMGESPIGLDDYVYDAAVGAAHGVGHAHSQGHGSGGVNGGGSGAPGGNGRAFPKLLHLIRDPNGSHVIHAILDHFPLNFLHALFKTAFRAVRSLGIDQHGLCVLKKCMSLSPPVEFVNFSFRVLEHVLEYVNNQYGNYLIQHLIERANNAAPAGAETLDESTQQSFAALNDALYRSLKGHFARLSRQKFSSNVVEKMLRVCDHRIRSSIIEEVIAEDVIPSLLQCSYGNYVMQHVLYVAEPQQAFKMAQRIRQEHILNNLKKNVRHKWERLLANANFMNAPPITPPGAPNSNSANGGAAIGVGVVGGNGLGGLGNVLNRGRDADGNMNVNGGYLGAQPPIKLPLGGSGNNSANDTPRFVMSNQNAIATPTAQTPLSMSVSSSHSPSPRLHSHSNSSSNANSGSASPAAHTQTLLQRSKSPAVNVNLNLMPSNPNSSGVPIHLSLSPPLPNSLHNNFPMSQQSPATQSPKAAQMLSPTHSGGSSINSFGLPSAAHSTPSSRASTNASDVDRQRAHSLNSSQIRPPLSRPYSNSGASLHSEGSSPAPLLESGNAAAALGSGISGSNPLAKSPSPKTSSAGMESSRPQSTGGNGNAGAGDSASGNVSGASGVNGLLEDFSAVGGVGAEELLNERDRVHVTTVVGPRNGSDADRFAYQPSSRRDRSVQSYSPIQQSHSLGVYHSQSRIASGNSSLGVGVGGAVSERRQLSEQVSRALLSKEQRMHGDRDSDRMRDRDGDDDGADESSAANGSDDTFSSLRGVHSHSHSRGDASEGLDTVPTMPRRGMNSNYNNASSRTLIMSAPQATRQLQMHGPAGVAHGFQPRDPNAMPHNINNLNGSATTAASVAAMSASHAAVLGGNDSNRRVANANHPSQTPMYGSYAQQSQQTASHNSSQSASHGVGYASHRPHRGSLNGGVTPFNLSAIRSAAPFISNSGPNSVRSPHLAATNPSSQASSPSNTQFGGSSTSSVSAQSPASINSPVVQPGQWARSQSQPPALSPALTSQRTRERERDRMLPGSSGSAAAGASYLSNSTASNNAPLDSRFSGANLGLNGSGSDPSLDIAMLMSGDRYANSASSASAYANASNSAVGSGGSSSSLQSSYNSALHAGSAFTPYDSSAHLYSNSGNADNTHTTPPGGPSVHMNLNMNVNVPAHYYSSQDSLPVNGHSHGHNSSVDDMSGGSINVGPSGLSMPMSMPLPVRSFSDKSLYANNSANSFNVDALHKQYGVTNSSGNALGGNVNSAEYSNAYSLNGGVGVGVGVGVGHELNGLASDGLLWPSTSAVDW